MSEIDRVFARLQDTKSPSNDRRELVNVPRRGATGGSRVVEVVHLRSGSAGLGKDGAGKDRPRAASFSVRSQTWDNGYPARTVAAPQPQPELAETRPAAVEPAPAVHVMPAWAPTRAEPEMPPAPVAPEPVRTRAPRAPAAPRQKAVQFADPFDSADDRANCLRCGYAVEPARDQRGLMTCAACG